MDSAAFSPLAVWGPPAAVFDRLEGRWRLDRSIAGQATMQGQAAFGRVGADRLHYREQGRVVLASGQAFDGHRDYLFERGEDGFSVLFAEEPPRLFHRIVLARTADAIEGAAGHLCAADQYDSRYRFLEDGAFVIEHRVRGPRKDYLSRTVFTRG